MYKLIIIQIVTLSMCISVYCQECKYEIVESMPDQLSFNQTLSFQPTPTHRCLIDMANNAKSTLKIASFYWTLTAEPQFSSHPSANAGRDIMESVIAAANRGVKLEVVLDKSSRKNMNNEDDIKRLESVGSVKYVNMTKLLKSGVLHTKLMIVDEKTFYLGSSNFDWRSYTQIKEIGIKMNECPELTQDIIKIFQTYMFMADTGDIPSSFPDYLKTNINVDNPLNLTLNNFGAKVFFGASPPAFNGIKNDWTGRSDDIDGLLHIMDKAKHRLDISVMNYSPTTEFIWPKKFWPRIDDALRRAAFERHIKVRLLFSDWSHNKEEELMWYRSLNAVQSKAMKGSIHVKMFEVPSYDDFQKSIPYARVKHDKYMVTDRGLYIGTSNWAADYFINTCGISLVIEPDNNKDFDNKMIGNEIIVDTKEDPIIKRMQDLFDRDFSSEFAHELM